MNSLNLTKIDLKYAVWLVSDIFVTANLRSRVDETVLGNHYSLRAEHEKAVRYFRRATELDRTYLSAWTLMGHEYVEMKNSHAAIEAYRRAVGRC